MSPAAIITIAVVVIVVLAGHRARHGRPPGRRSRRRCVEPRDATPRQGRRDRSARRRRPVAPSSAPSAEARSTGLVPAAPSTPAGLGRARRGRTSVSAVVSSSTAPPSSLTGAGLTTFAAAGFVAFLWPTAQGGFGGKINVGKIDDVVVQHPVQRRLLLQRHGAFVGHAVPDRRRAEGQERADLQAACSPAWRTASSPSTRSARTSVAACRSASAASGSSARATARSTTASARRRAAPRRAAWIASRLVVSNTGDVVIDTGTVYPGPPIGTNTTGQEAEGPHCIGGRGGHG